jgi:hypothetical protein
MGPDADRVLLVVDRPAVSHGFLSQELGLAGHLARQLSALSGRGTDIDILANGNMPLRDCTQALRDVDLSRFDAIVLLLGSSEALSLATPKRWSLDLDRLLADVTARMRHRMHLVIIEIPPTRALIDFPHPFGRVVDARVEVLNRITREIGTGRDLVTVITFPLPAASADGRNSSRTFELWARLIAPSIHVLLDQAGGTGRQDPPVDERRRQGALDSMQILDSSSNSVIDAVVSTARDLFHASAAALTFLDRDRRWVKSAAGAQIADSPRVGSLCDLAIAHTGVFVIEDLTQTDHHDMSIAPDVVTAFYAGFPIEAPDGRRVGVLSIMDARPRPFGPRDRSQLRELALQIQMELWHGPQRGSSPTSR